MNQLTENLREVRAGLENITGRRELDEAPADVKDHFYSALGHLSRAIQLMTFKYNDLDGKVVVKDGVPFEQITTRQG